MRWLLLVSISACAVAGPIDQPAATLHDRLSDGVRVAVTGTGSVTAEHRGANETWVGGEAPIAISVGELAAWLEGDRLGAELDVSFDPVVLPESVFGQPASLTGVRITASSSTVPTWTSDDHATAALDLALDLSWSITIGGGSTSLGVQHLPTIPLDVELTGTGSGVDANLELKGPGELWSWAALVRLSDLALSLAATR